MHEAELTHESITHKGLTLKARKRHLPVWKAIMVRKASTCPWSLASIAGVWP